jgi:hypothetical protein
MLIFGNMPIHYSKVLIGHWTSFSSLGQRMTPTLERSGPISVQMPSVRFTIHTAKHGKRLRKGLPRRRSFAETGIIGLG